MAIDLPPVMPPQLATHVQIEAAAQANAEAITAVVAGITLRVVGNQYLSPAQITAILSAAETPSAAITALTRRYYNAGYLLVSVSYFRVDDTVTILVNQAAVKGFRGNPAITAHFDGLVGDPDLSLAEFDRARVLADLHAQRAGLAYSIAYEQHYDNQVILDFREVPVDNHDATDVVLEANNKGSRFLGRYFGLAGVRHRFTSGTEASVAYKTIFEEFGEAGDGDGYQQMDISIEHPFTFGLYGLDLTRIEYERQPVVGGGATTGGLLGLCLPPLISCTPSGGSTVVDLDAKIDIAALSGEQVLYSNPVRRWSVFERIEYVNSEIQSDLQSQPLLDESYQTLELGAKYSVRGALGQSPSYFKAQLSVRGGFGDGGSLESNRSDGVGIGQRSADFLMLRPKLGYKLALAPQYELALNLDGQFTDNTQLPQQQQYVLGGMNSLSAYLPGVLIGDNGYFLHAAINAKQRVWGMPMEASIFVEYGATSFNNVSGELGSDQIVADAGVRLSLELAYGFETELVAAAPLMDDVVDQARLDTLEADFFWRLRWTF
ncbi:ShlB/FhaC/HecB family hemolysin secretion/activation protein [Zhongshania aquimaris]|uniref:Hemin-binding protein n=1 Tax=Zhongshania aquimaris TaxID=2857107 RepID=A0ABS6VR10_9GAMM|nr:ShlB/FhaC/HecB family hemolysin secretion/activation protein [Zhongshania aquimaris]MBW2940747.1 hemin-binding protein [Zhongshania aquimaris]